MNREAKELRVLTDEEIALVAGGAGALDALSGLNVAADVPKLNANLSGLTGNLGSVNVGNTNVSVPLGDAIEADLGGAGLEV